MAPILSLRAVQKRYAPQRALLSFRKAEPVVAVRGVSLDIAENEVVALVGESGSGKTTLGNMALGLEVPTEGSVEWNGRPLSTLSKAERLAFRKDVQVVFQNPYASLNPRDTIRSALSKPLVHHRIVSSGDQDAEVARLLELVGLAPAATFIDRYPHEFSGGQRQRIAIARALSLNPRLIVADEPVSALDVSIRGQILDLLQDLRERLRMSMLFITHDLGVVRHIADRILVMNRGEVVEAASNEAFFACPAHEYSRELLGSALSPDPARNHIAIARRGRTPAILRSSHPTSPEAGVRNEN